MALAVSDRNLQRERFQRLKVPKSSPFRPETESESNFSFHQRFQGEISKISSHFAMFQMAKPDQSACYCYSSSKSDVCLTSLLSNAGRFIPKKKLGQYSVLFWHKVDSIISLSRVEHANFFFCQHTSRVTKFEAGLNFSIENHRQQNQPKFKIPSSKASLENPKASKGTPGKN